MMYSNADVAVMQSQPTMFDEPFNMQDDPRHKMDDKLYVQFYKRAVMNAYKSSQEGRPIFDELDYVRVIVPGSKDVLDVEVEQQYRQRFSKQWEKYQTKQTQSMSGTPLSTWPALTVGMVAELNALNVFTVEQLATLNDEVAGRVMGFNMLKQRAQAFLDAASGDAANSKLAAELEKRDQEIELLKQQMQELMKQTAAAKAAPIEKAK
jgi:hypothetical protein